MSEPITSAQRWQIDMLLSEAELPTDFVTIMFRTIDVGDDWQGRRVCHWMDSLSKADASNYITKLKKLTRDEARAEN